VSSKRRGISISGDSPAEELDTILTHARQPCVVELPELPPPHPAEADIFARHEGVPAHQQETLEAARLLLVGGGGLNSWAALALLRSGAKNLTIIDPDIVDRPNLSRQLYFGADLGQPKATRLAANLAAHGLGRGTITGLPRAFDRGADEFALAADILVVGVDNNRCRLQCVQWARQRGIPAVFTMLSRDGMRCHCFLQGPGASDACLWCALPNLDPEVVAPCASAIVTSCLLAAAYTVFFVHRALMGWPAGVFFNWREADLLEA
jgi:molybdopterin/thiamine biosynthesis adenylyltransferase